MQIDEWMSCDKHILLVWQYIKEIQGHIYLWAMYVYDNMIYSLMHLTYEFCTIISWQSELYLRMYFKVKG